jgi:hypothetical protein
MRGVGLVNIQVSKLGHPPTGPQRERFCRSRPVGHNRAVAPLHIQLANSTLRRVIKRLHFPLEIMLMRSLVRRLSAEPAQLGRDDGRAWGAGRPFHCPSLGAKDAAGSGRSVPASQASSRSVLACVLVSSYGEGLLLHALVNAQRSTAVDLISVALGHRDPDRWGMFTTFMPVCSLHFTRARHRPAAQRATGGASVMRHCLEQHTAFRLAQQQHPIVHTRSCQGMLAHGLL